MPQSDKTVAQGIRDGHEVYDAFVKTNFFPVIKESSEVNAYIGKLSDEDLDKLQDYALGFEQGVIDGLIYQTRWEKNKRFEDKLITAVPISGQSS